MYYIYVLQSIKHGTRYVGCTKDVKKRFTEHNDGRCRYTKGRRPWEVMYQEKFGTLSEARKREIQIKGWSRDKKEKLINGEWE